MKTLLLIIISLNCLSFELKFLQQITFDHNLEVDGTILGGLSGVRYSESEYSLYAISDDRSKLSPARFYKFKIKQGKSGFEISHPAVIILNNQKGNNFKDGTIDFEAIDILKDGSLLITSEGNLAGRKLYPPRVINFSKDGKYIREISITESFIPKRVNGHFTSGTRNNLSFESLSLDQGNNYFFLAPESNLKQDFNKESTLIRISKYKKNKKDRFSSSKEFVYKLGPYKDLGVLSNDLTVYSGVSAILTLKNEKLLVIERSFYPAYFRMKIVLFLANISTETTDVSSFNSILNKEYNPIKKKELLDFDILRDSLNKDNQHIDNIEGVTYGPKLKNGNDTLIFVSDNNFSSKQSTQFIIMEIVND